MHFVEQIFTTLPEGEIVEVVVALHWTAVVVRVEGKIRCGLSATLREEHGHSREPDVPDAGKLTDYPARVIAEWVFSQKPTLASIGGAALNALMPLYPDTWVECNASEFIAERGKGKCVALVGHFSFVDNLRERVGELYILEKNPQAGDFPAEAAPHIIPKADVVAITGMTITNHTLFDLLQLCSSGAEVMLLGPSTPLSPILFEHGINYISGAVVDDIGAVVKTLKEGANFHQIRKSGARLVTMVKERYGKENASFGKTGSGNNGNTFAAK